MKQVILGESQNPASRLYRGNFPLDITQYILVDYLSWYKCFRGQSLEDIDLAPMAAPSRWSKIRTDAAGCLYLSTTDQVVVQATPHAKMKFEVMSADTVLTETGPHGEYDGFRDMRYRDNQQSFIIVSERLFVFTLGESRVYNRASNYGLRCRYGDLDSPFFGTDVVVDPQQRFYYLENNLCLSIMVVDQQMKRVARYRNMIMSPVNFITLDPEGYMILGDKEGQIYIINTHNFSLRTKSWEVVHRVNLNIPIESLTVNPRTKQVTVLSEGHLVTYD